MSLFSFTFLLFFLIVLLVYYTIPKKIQWICLLVASYVFYMWADPIIVVFLLFTTLCTFLIGLWLQRKNDDQAKRIKEDGADKKEIRKRFTRKKRQILALGVVLPFAVLAVVKYANFVIGNVNSLLSLTDTGFSLRFIDIILPLGISFYTFQTVGYLIDVYRGKVTADRNFFRYSLFVSYFPQIIQGPIGRHRDLAHQLFEMHRFDLNRIKFAAQLILWGFIKKMVIADRIAILVNEVFGNFYENEYGGLIVFLAVFCYSIQIYADFSGGMDIVCGISHAFGIELAENFRRPFLAKSVSEFWQRWHITLGSWMRDYLFYPLALSKPFGKMSKLLRKLGSNYAAKVLPTCLASFIVFTLIGLWHGASWKYIAYGLYSAFFVSTGTLLEPLYAKGRKLFHVQPDRFSFRVFRILRTVFLVTIGRYFSRAVSFQNAVHMLIATFTVWNPWVFFDDTLPVLCGSEKNLTLMILLIGLLFAVDLIQEKGIALREKLAEQGIVFRWIVYIVGIFALIILGVYGGEYSASNFIYQGF